MDLHRVHYLDASVLVKLVVQEDGTNAIKEYMRSERTSGFHATSLCFAEALGVLKYKYLGGRDRDENAYFTAGDELSLGDHFEAIRDYDKAIELDPKYAGAYSNRGLAYAKLGDYRQAIRDYDRAIELDPKFAGAYNNRGTAYGEMGNHQQAIGDFKIAARLGLKKAQDYLKSKGISW